MGKLDVHPDAAIYPMLSGDELAALAADIKQNGLRFPIILDAEGKTLIDGRNRLAACELVGVEPRFERLNGEDPKAFIVSANLERRDMTRGQKAMARAFHYPEPERGGKREAGVKIIPGEFNKAGLSHARTVSCAIALVAGSIGGSTARAHYVLRGCPHCQCRNTIHLPYVAQCFV
jgi:ParB-like nuclease domain